MKKFNLSSVAAIVNVNVAPATVKVDFTTLDAAANNGQRPAKLPSFVVCRKGSQRVLMCRTIFMKIR